jgi:glycosyltransferase involved in cell wall biosynthesis
VLAISSVIHRNVLETTPIAPDRVMTLHDAVDTDLFSPGRTDRRRVREEFGYDDDMTVIGFVGRFSPGKGLEEFLEAANALRTQFANARFLVVGEASFGEEGYARNIYSMYERLNLRDAVTFAGFRRDIPDVMASFDILAFPSHAESFGMVLIEAMALERPVVSTNCDGVLDIVVDGVTGLYVHPKKGLELAEALARLIGDPGLRERMGKAGRRRVVELFDKKKQIDRIEQIYCALLASA